MRNPAILWRNATPHYRDLVLSCSLVLLVYAAAWAWNLSERISQLLWHYEFVQLDELPLALFAAAVASAWYSGRRLRDLQQEIARRTQAEQELARLLEENRALGEHARQAQEEERRILARELHDEIGQYLTAIRLCATAIGSNGTPSARENAGRISAHAAHLQNCCKGMLQHLRPVVLDQSGLIDGLRQLVAGWEKQNPHTACSLALDADCNALPDNIKTAAYRIVQEAMTNVARHARAQHVAIRVHRLARAGIPHLLVEIRDDGIGFTRVPRQSCFGLLGMRERAEALGGTYTLVSGFDAGVQITVLIPMENTV